MRPRRIPLLASAVLCATALLTPGTAVASTAGPVSPYDGGGALLNILPPGSRAFDTPTDAAQAEAGHFPPNTVDQEQMYDALNKAAPSQLTDAQLPSYFKNGQLGVAPADVTSTETPLAGVTIKRDKQGVPHVFGTSYDNVAYGAGYVGAEDRMFLMDVLRHYGAARLASFLGAGKDNANIELDRAQLAAADYTPAEAQAQLQLLQQRFPTRGKRLVEALGHFVAGINAAQHRMCPVVVAPTCPAEYAALQQLPTDYAPADIVSIASLVGGIFGKGGGGELANALWLRRLQAKFGASTARQIFADLREANDPAAPTTIPTSFPYETAPAGPTPGAALPDLPDGHNVAGGTGSDPGGGPVPGLPSLPGLQSARVSESGAPARPDHIDGPFGAIRLDAGSGHSNALLVDAKHSATGHPLAVFGPQVGYFSPQILDEVDLEGPGVAARGASFPGTELVVELGHGLDYAWSATSASGDNIDTVVERLCNSDGSAPTIDSTSYVDASGHCTSMKQPEHTELVKPNPTDQSPPQLVRMQDLRTRHGVVQERTTVDGTPVAIVLQRSTYGHELDSAVGFSEVNDPSVVHDAASFQHAFGDVDYTFNWFYADDRDIAYKESGLLPLRASGVDPSLPRWGSPSYDWHGWLSFDGLPHAINPAQGYFANWNNKPAPGFSAADNDWGYGSIYRSMALRDRIVAGISGGRKMTRAGLVGAMIDAATVDVRGAYLLPDLLGVIGNDPSQAAALGVLRTWLSHGAHREDRNRDGSYTDQAAIALFDEWWDSQTTTPTGQKSVAKDVLSPVLGSLVDQLPQAIDDHPRQGLGSSWNDVAWYGYVDKDLRRVLGHPLAGSYSRAYCGTLAACQTSLRASLAAAVQREAAKQGTTDVSAWKYDKAQDYIRFTNAGVVGVPPMDWQNRPTFQQVVDFSTHRPRAAAATGVGAGSPGPGTGAAAGAPRPDTTSTQVAAASGTLAFTGSPPLLPLGAVVLVGGGLLMAHRRRAARLH